MYGNSIHAGSVSNSCGFHVKIESWEKDRAKSKIFSGASALYSHVFIPPTTANSLAFLVENLRVSVAYDLKARNWYETFEFVSLLDICFIHDIAYNSYAYGTL